MQELASVRGRLKTVTGIRSVCSTLATVAAAKLSRTRDRALGARVYTERLREIVGRQLLAAREEGIAEASLSPLLATREPHGILLLAVGSDQGLCGGYNMELDAEIRRRLGEWHRSGTDTTLVIRGSHTARIIRRDPDASIVDASSWPRAGVTDADVDRLFARTLELFEGGTVDEVWATYTAYLSAVQREPRTVRLLPIHVPAAPDSAVLRYVYEPARQPPLDELLGVLARLQIEDAMLEAFSAEQSARMVTMQEATERADTALAELRIRYNRLRRESITADLTGILVARRVRTETADAS